MGVHRWIGCPPSGGHHALVVLDAAASVEVEGCSASRRATPLQWAIPRTATTSWSRSILRQASRMASASTSSRSISITTTIVRARAMVKRNWPKRRAALMAANASMPPATAGSPPLTTMSALRSSKVPSSPSRRSGILRKSARGYLMRETGRPMMSRGSVKSSRPIFGVAVPLFDFRNAPKSRAIAGHPSRGDRRSVPVFLNNAPARSRMLAMQRSPRIISTWLSLARSAAACISLSSSLRRGEPRGWLFSIEPQRFGHISMTTEDSSSESASSLITRCVFRIEAGL
mmetsp:Transcript_1000/g.1845  ORF Transcript_1000/g.1845 Transcript_1000/m.1845 type:complete len:287 (-) Transcript_1000:142-1002(-)